MSRYYKLAQKEHPLAVRIVAVLFAGVLIVYLIPRFIINQGRALDELLGLSDLYFGAINLLIGGLLALAGLSLGLWSVLDQFERGRGTPLPFMPTQELLVSGPFRYCRNPMTLGTIVFYLGIAIAAGTLCGAADRPAHRRGADHLSQALRRAGAGRALRRGVREV